MDVWLDEAHDFVIRKAKSMHTDAEALTEIGPYVSFGDGGWLPKKYVQTFYTLKAAPSGSAGERGDVVQRIEFELLGGVETSDIPDSYFTLDSLGVSSPRRPRTLWLCLALGAVLLVAVVVLSRRKRRVHQGVPGSPIDAPQPGGS